jgi:hypothetical protein
VPILDPKTKEEDKRRLEYAEIFWKERRRKGISQQMMELSLLNLKNNI